MVVWPARVWQFLGAMLMPGRIFANKPEPRHKAAGDHIEGSFVYVVRGDHNMVKIGVTTNPSARLASLRTGSAFQIYYAFIGITPGALFVLAVVSFSSPALAVFVGGPPYADNPYGFDKHYRGPAKL